MNKSIPEMLADYLAGFLLGLGCGIFFAWFVYPYLSPQSKAQPRVGVEEVRSRVTCVPSGIGRGYVWTTADRKLTAEEAREVEEAVAKILARLNQPEQLGPPNIEEQP